jgi:hypothetical protein
MTWMPLGIAGTSSALVMFSYLVLFYQSEATWGDLAVEYSLCLQEFVNDLDAPGY